MRQIVILCGGIGSRVYPLTKNKPKALLKVKKKPFLYYQLKLLEKFQFEEVILCTGYLSNKIEEFIKFNKFKFKIKVIKDGKQLLGTGGAIKKIMNQLDANFFVTYGDTILKIDYNLVWKKFIKSKKKNIMCIKLNSSQLEKSNVKIIKKKIFYKKTNNVDKKMKYIDYGCSILSKETFKLINKKKFDLGLVFEKLCNLSKIDFYLTKQNYFEIGSISSFKNFQKRFDKIYR